MKKFRMTMLFAVAIMQLTACNINVNDFINKQNDTEQVVESVVCTVDTVSFSVPGDWTPLEKESSYASADRKAAYQLQGISMLGNYSPQEFYVELVDYYGSSNEVIYNDAKPEQIILDDGADALVGRIELKDESVCFSIDVLIVPQKNTVVTYAVQYVEGNTPSVDIREITKTTEVLIGKDDMITGKTFVNEAESMICLNEDGNFIYYQHKDNLEDSYVSGPYEVYRGQEAVDKVATMTEYGLTKEELTEILSNDMNGYTPGGSNPMDLLGGTDKEVYHVCPDTFYALILHKKQLLDGGVTTEMDATVLYIGYYIPELELLDFTNANTASHIQFMLVEE